ncbi:MAG: RHS repeat-associated core domain-containing protein [Bacteroidales bacterium]|jgi:RHS repeat-associated protein|nr:RHS repeat-associated core domain-containing protein [Bacteroidales bacterium]
MNRNPTIGNTIISIKVDDDVLWVAGNTETMHYVHTAYLGSYTYIACEDGELAEVLSYDPWGRLRNAYDWADYNVTPTRFDRGYTGHVRQPFGLPSEANQLRMPIPKRNEFGKHLNGFQLINMLSEAKSRSEAFAGNGRVYDPFLARFLSPDPQLQSPDYSQNYNRYSYAWNNPLKYTDPSGEFIHLVIGAAIGGVFNWLANGAQFNAAGLGHFGVGALAGGLGAGIGAGFGALASGAGHFSFMSSAALGAQGFGAGAAVGFGTGFTGGMVTGTGNSLIQGENIGKALSNGLNSALWGGAIGGLTGGVYGGIRASRAGNNFWSGNPAGGKYGGVPQVDMGQINSNTVLSHGIKGKLNTMNDLVPFYTDSHLEFNGKYIEFVNNYCDGYQCVADTWDAVSGPYGNGSLPKGNWVSSEIVLLDPLKQSNFNSYSKENYGFWMKLKPLFNTTRNGIGYHPDGGVSGTLGCIGLTGSKQDMIRFYNQMSSYFGSRGDIYTIVK